MSAAAEWKGVGWRVVRGEGAYVAEFVTEPGVWTRSARFDTLDAARAHCQMFDWPSRTALRKHFRHWMLA